MFTGATNAFTGESGLGKNMLTGQASLPFPNIARDYKARGVAWIAIGDENYGEGSSREHAAMEPRFLNGRVVLVKSFARIHETNLKKQGMLPLTFKHPGDYDKIREDDRLSVIGLKNLAPNQLLEVVIKHADGKSETISVQHSFTTEQIEWFKAGSALNKIAAELK